MIANVHCKWDSVKPMVDHPERHCVAYAKKKLAEYAKIHKSYFSEQSAEEIRALTRGMKREYWTPTVPIDAFGDKEELTRQKDSAIREYLERFRSMRSDELGRIGIGPQYMAFYAARHSDIKFEPMNKEAGFYSLD